MSPFIDLSLVGEEAGGLESLVILLSEKEASCCVYAASCIISMASNCKNE